LAGQYILSCHTCRALQPHSNASGIKANGVAARLASLVACRLRARCTCKPNLSTQHIQFPRRSFDLAFMGIPSLKNIFDIYFHLLLHNRHYSYSTTELHIFPPNHHHALYSSNHLPFKIIQPTVFYSKLYLFTFTYLLLFHSRSNPKAKVSANAASHSDHAWDRPRDGLGTHSRH